MLGDERLIAFIPVSDLDRARQFYEATLGLRVTDANSFAVVVQANGVTVRLTHVPDLTPQVFTIAGWQVADIEATMDELVARGVVFRRYDGMGQNDRGIWEAPSGDLVAWFSDPDGNTLSLGSSPVRDEGGG
jgi:catechol 2,3-dioxygenase-like lactoylglutathione lyase family enzyme